MKAAIDENSCTGCEECVLTCPEVFEMNMTTYLATVKSPEIPAEYEADAVAAAESCPVDAISLS